MSLFIAEPPSPQANESNVIETEVRLNASNKHDEVSYINSAPLIRSRLWRFINLLTYLLTYLHIRPTQCVFTHALFTVCDAAVNYKNLGLFITEQQRIIISSEITFTIETWGSETSVRIESRIESAATIRMRIETWIESADIRLQLQC